MQVKYYLEYSENLTTRYKIPGNGASLCRYQTDGIFQSYDFVDSRWEKEYPLSDSEFTPISEQEANKYILINKLKK